MWLSIGDIRYFCLFICISKCVLPSINTGHGKCVCVFFQQSSMISKRLPLSKIFKVFVNTFWVMMFVLIVGHYCDLKWLQVKGTKLCRKYKALHVNKATSSHTICDDQSYQIWLNSDLRLQIRDEFGFHQSWFKLNILARRDHIQSVLD